MIWIRDDFGICRKKTETKSFHSNWISIPRVDKERSKTLKSTGVLGVLRRKKTFFCAKTTLAYYTDIRVVVVNAAGSPIWKWIRRQNFNLENCFTSKSAET
jgi:hypothetical protein